MFADRIWTKQSSIHYIVQYINTYRDALTDYISFCLSELILPSIPRAQLQVLMKYLRIIHPFKRTLHYIRLNIHSRPRPLSSSYYYYFFFSKSLFAKFFTWILWPYYILRSRYPNWEHRAAITPNSIVTNGGGVCQYDITNATANYDAVSMTTLGHQFKDKQIIIATWMHHIYSKKKWQKGARNLERFMGPITVEQVHL